MKKFIFTYDRYKTITTSEYFKAVPHLVLCHTEEAKEKFIDAGRIHGQIIATGRPKGLSNNRNFALDLMDNGEWAMFWVDDLISNTYLNNYHTYLDRLNVDGDNQPFYRQEFKAECTPGIFEILCEEIIQHAEQKGFALCGFSLTDNPLFRNKKYSYWCLADGRCWLVKKTHLRFDTNVQLIDDTCFTALNLKTFGGVVVNNWILPLCERYTEGAFGTISDRMEQKKKECAYLVETYPDLICFADKVGWEQGSHVKIRQKKINIKQATMF